MTNPAHSVRYHCHVCGQMHPVCLELPLPGGLTGPCTLADLYPSGNMSPSIVDFLTNYLLWCDQAGDYTKRDDLTCLPFIACPTTGAVRKVDQT